MNKYNKFMSKIEVTEEMRSRILKNISEADFTPAKKSVFVHMGGFAAAAACLALIVIGGISLARFTGGSLTRESDAVTTSSKTAEAETGDNTLAVYDVTEYESLEELSAAVGYSITLPVQMPFEYDSVSYAEAWGCAEITWYSGENTAAYFRMGKADGDISGDYSEYETATEVNAGGVNVTLKGSGDSVVLAVWSYGEMSYALGVSEGITAEQVKAFVSEVTL